MNCPDTQLLLLKVPLYVDPQFNCNALYQLGPLVEMTSGHLRYLTVYLGSAIAGTAMSFFCSPHPSIGASGK